MAVVRLLQEVRKMRRFAFVSSALLLTVTLVLFPGCEDDENGDGNPAGPGGGGDTLTTQEVLEQLDQFSAGIVDPGEECEALYMLNGLTIAQNSRELAFLLRVIDEAIAEDGDLSSWYGTWVDTSSGILPIEMIRTDTVPANAVRVQMLGVDTLGHPVNGDITLHEFLMRDDSDTLLISVSAHVDGSADSLALVIEGVFDLENQSGELAIGGNICATTFHLAIETDDATEEVALSGWYDYPGEPKIWFEFTGTVTEDEQDPEEEAEIVGTIHVWTTENPTIDMVITAVNDPDTCMTGTITLDGSEEVELLVGNCEADTPDVYLLVDGHPYEAEEFLETLYDVVFGIDLGAFGGILLGKSEESIELWPLGKRRPEMVERLR